MSNNRPPIPPEVKRILRKEAGFGCVVCGYPIYDYHHIIEFSHDPHMRPEDMIILCPNHHREVRKISEVKQREYKAIPFNIKKGYTNGQLTIDEPDLMTEIGGNVFINNGFILTVDDEPLLSVKVDESGKLLLTATLYDKEDNCIALIQDNEWISGDSNIWDLTFGFNWIRILKKSREVSLYIDASTYILRITGNFWRKRHFFKCDKNRIRVGYSSTPSKILNMGFVGALLNIVTKSEMFEIKSSYPNISHRVMGASTYSYIREAYQNYKKDLEKSLANK